LCLLIHQRYDISTNDSRPMEPMHVSILTRSTSAWAITQSLKALDLGQHDEEEKNVLSLTIELKGSACSSVSVPFPALMGD